MGMVFLGASMLRNPPFERALGIGSILIALAMLVFNLATAPVPPAELVDLGALAGLWFLIVSIQLWRCARTRKVAWRKVA
ncbi:MAG: hypothetical protein NZ746_11185 [Blastocatellia bacterium]|nr:hypothetical protein [Blastocatellia bacterium]